MANEKIRENRLREAAKRQGLTLTRSRRRDPRAIGYGRYWLTSTETGISVTPHEGSTLDEIERHLMGSR